MLGQYSKRSRYPTDRRIPGCIASDGLTDNVHLDEIIEYVRKGPLAASARDVADLARRRMLHGAAKQPSKPDDLSLILFRKPDRARNIDE